MDRQLETTMKIRIVQGIYYITLCVFLFFLRRFGVPLLLPLSQLARC